MGKKKKSKNYSKKKFRPDKRKVSPGSKFSVEDYKKRIVLFLKKNEGRELSLKELKMLCKCRNGITENFEDALKMLCKAKIVRKGKKGYKINADDLYRAEIVRLNRTFGFAKREDNENEVFVPGKMLLGSLVGDIVLMRDIEPKGDGEEGMVVDIVEYNNKVLSGTIVDDDGREKVICDTMCSTPIRIDYSKSVPFEVGEKVLCEVVKRGVRHSEHIAVITYSYGKITAENCSMALIDSSDIPFDFPEEVLDEARKVSSDKITSDERLDLRDEIIFTIDSEYSKDLDDAVSISKTSDGYSLGVHIADVSNYVRFGTPLDKEAMKRGTSIYYADKVIPMLPVELSNGICSLNPNEDRLAFSAIMQLNTKGELVSYEFKKTIIKSRVKGVYKEVNSILDKTASDDIKLKYNEMMDTIYTLKELADLRIALRKKRGAPSIESIESQFKVENGVCVDVFPRQSGESEGIIEEMMLLANESAAKFSKKYQLPFVYRIHEDPSDEKISNLISILTKLGVDFPQYNHKIKPAHLSQVLEKTKDETFFPIVNNMVLRSMSKAKYSEQPIGHFGLAIEDYSHFTSPIRRYSDLAIHRIMSAFLKLQAEGKNELGSKYNRFAVKAANASTETEIRAVAAERKCESYYKAEYMSEKIGEKFDGLISGITESGIYVELPNSIEGMIRISSMPEGNYDIESGLSVTEMLSGKSYRVGDKIFVQCVKSDISNGNVDFVLEQND